ncbi:MAG: RHS repeat protein [Dehalococcoidia bacterium]|nr:RHS repeat protein [Dehalococcoidia bacterium]
MTDTRVARKAANRPTTVTDRNLDITTYAYDDAGRMASSTLPTGTDVVSTHAYVVGRAEPQRLIWLAGWPLGANRDSRRHVRDIRRVLFQLQRLRLPCCRESRIPTTWSRVWLHAHS